MGLFRHPHLVRGIVHTSEGAFQIERGIADLPDEVGAALGWIRVDDDSTSVLPPGQPAAKATPATSGHAGAL
jgi:hypothetical protein